MRAGTTMPRSQKTQEILRDYIESYREEHGYVPRRAEMARHVGLSTHTVKYHLGRMEKAGMITLPLAPVRPRPKPRSRGLRKARTYGLWARIIKFIREYSALTSRPPTYDEIASEFGLAKSIAHYHIGRMCERGILERELGKARTITVADDAEVPAYA